MGTKISDETAEKLQELITSNADSAHQLEQAAESTKEPTLASLFKRFAEERRENADELGKYVNLSGHAPNKSGSMSSLLREAWIAIRAKMEDGDPFAILSETERCEDIVQSAYEEVIAETSGTAVTDILHAQYQKIKEGHERIQELKDSRKQ